MRRRVAAGSSPSADDAKRLLDDPSPEEGASELSGFHFDIELCRKAFDYYDINQSGTLDRLELRKLVDVLWATFNPGAPALDEHSRASMVSTILSGSSLGDAITFDEFVPWYHRMHQKFYAQEHEVGGDASAVNEQAAPVPDQKHAAAQLHVVYNGVLKELWRVQISPGDLEAAARRVLEASLEIAKGADAVDATHPAFVLLEADQAYHRAIASIMLAGPSTHRGPNGNAEGWGEQARVSELVLEILLKSYVHIVGRSTCSQLAQVEGLLEGLVVAAQRGSLKIKTCAAFILSQVALAGAENASADKVRSRLITEIVYTSLQHMCT